MTVSAPTTPSHKSLRLQSDSISWHNRTAAVEVETNNLIDVSNENQFHSNGLQNGHNGIENGLIDDSNYALGRFIFPDLQL